MKRFSAIARLGLVLCAVAAAGLRAQTPFSQSLTPPDWKDAGFARLSTEQMAVLDGLIQRDVEAARQGDVVAFAKTFTDRRTPEDWQRAGLGRLTEAERARLNAVVAAAIAARPAVAFMPHPATKGTAKDIATGPRPWEVHGEVSMFVGAGSGGQSWYGGSFETWATDPSHRLTVGVGMSEVRGKGFGYGYGCRRGGPGYPDLGY